MLGHQKVSMLCQSSSKSITSMTGYERRERIKQVPLGNLIEHCLSASTWSRVHVRENRGEPTFAHYGCECLAVVRCAMSIRYGGFSPMILSILLIGRDWNGAFSRDLATNYYFFHLACEQKHNYNLLTVMVARTPLLRTHHLCDCAKRTNRKPLASAFSFLSLTLGSERKNDKCHSQVQARENKRWTDCSRIEHTM